MVGDMANTVPNPANPNFKQDKFVPDIHYIIENKFLYKYIMKKLDKNFTRWNLVNCY